MTNITPTISYTKDGTAGTVHPIPFKLLQASDLEMYVDGVLSDDGFTVGGTLPDAASVVTTNDYTNGTKVTFKRNVTYEQQTTFAEGERYPGKRIENEFDNLAMQIQQVDEVCQRAIKTNPGETPPGGTVTKAINTSLGQDSDGNLVSRTVAEEVSFLGIGDSVTAAAASATAAQGFADSAEEQAGFANDERVLAEAAKTAAEAAQTLSSNTLLDLSTKSFPIQRIAGTLPAAAFPITGDIQITLPGGGEINLKNSERPYAETNAINAVGLTSAECLTLIEPIINGNVIDFDSGTEYGIDPTDTVSNYVPIPDWTAAFPILQGAVDDSVLDLTYYGTGDATITPPAEFTVVGSTDLNNPSALPFLNTGGTTELTALQKSNLASQWPEALGPYATPVFLSDTSLDANATATTAAIQSAIDTRRAVFIPAGIYKLNATLSLSTQGQVIRGESCTRTILQWISDVDGMEITTSDESNTTNFPGSSVDGSSWGRVSDLLLYGPSGSTKKAFKNTTDASPTLWIGEGWRLDFLTVSRWETGLYSTKAARYNCRSLTFKDCSNRCIFLSDDDGVNNSATNNCHIFNGINCSNSGIGLELKAVYSGIFTLQDFAALTLGVKVYGASQCDFNCGEIEIGNAFEIDASLVTIKGMRVLGDPNISPITVNNSSSLLIENTRQAQAGNTKPLVTCLDAGSKVFGYPASNLVGGDPGNVITSKVELSNGDIVFISPFPWTPNYSNVGSDVDERGAMSWRNAVPANHHNMDDLQATIEVNGEYMHAGVFKSNHFTIDHPTTVPYTPQGWEDVILMSATGARTVNMRATSSPYYRAGPQFRKVTIVDASGNAGTNNITINTGLSGIVAWSNSATYDVGDVVQDGGLRYVANTAHTATGGVFADDVGNWDQVDETINGQTNYVISENYGSVTLGFLDDGKIFVVK